MKHLKIKLKKGKRFGLLIGLLFFMTHASAQVNLSNGLVGYYPLDNNRLDYSGNGNNGTAAGGTGFTTDRLGNLNSAASFGGTGNPGKITILHTPSLVFTSGASFAFWARVSSATGTFGTGTVGSGGSQCLFAKAGDAGGGFWQLSSFASNTLNNQIGNNASPTLSGALSPYALNEWFHYVVTMDANGHNIYVNGVLQSANTDPANLAALTNRNLVLGRFNSNWYPLNGAIDEFRVYNRVITNDEIQALMEDELATIEVTLGGATAFCAGDQVTVNYTSTGEFAAGNVFNLQLSDALGSFATPAATAQITSSANTGSITITLPEILSTSSNYRFRIISSAPNAISDTTATITVNGVLGSIPDPALYTYLGTVNGNYFYVSTTTNTWAQSVINAQLNGGHLAVIPDAATQTLLQNNIPTGGAYFGYTDELVEGTWRWANGAPTTYTNWNTGEPNNAGGGGGEDYAHMINTGRWNDIGGNNLAHSFMQFAPAGVNQTICSGANINLQASPLTGGTYSWSGPNGFTSSLQNPTIPNATGLNSGTYTITYSLNGCSNTSSTEATVNTTPINIGQNAPLLTSLTNGLILHYPMNGNATDASGNGINGTMTGGITPMNDRYGNAGNALQFNGTNGFIDVPDGVFFNGSDFTVSAWVRKVSNNNFSRLFDFSNGQANENVLLAISSGTSGRPISQIYNGTTGGAQVSSPTVALTNNKWELLTYTWSNGNAVLYIDGLQRGQGAQTAPNNVLRTINYIGRSAWSTDGYANAGFDDFRIYNRKLNLSEIQSLVMEQPSNLSAIVTSGALCNGTAGQIALINSQNGVTYQMQNATTSTNVGASQIGNGDTLFFNTGVLSASTDFNFTASVTSGCNTTLTPNITVTVQPVPVAPIATNDTVCNHGIMTISVSGGSIYNWYNAPTGGTPLATITGNSYTTDNINATENYYVSLVDGNGCESPRTLVSAVVINPLNPPVDIISGLILNYKFQNNLADSSGNGYNATITGANSYVNDRNGNALSAINSTATGSPGNNFISAGNPAKVQQLTNQVTISMWIKQEQTWFGTSGTDGQMPLINKWDGSTGMWVGLRMQNPSNMSNRVRWRVNGATFIESNTNVPVGTWHHVVCTYNGSQLRIYQNGVQTATLNHTGSIGNTAQNLMLGRQANGTPSDGITYRGDWDEVKVYDRALNLSEIQTLFNNESVAFATSPLCDGEGDLALTTFNFPGATYNWTGPNGFTSTDQNPPVITNADSATYAGTYSLEVTTQGCTSPVQTVNAVIYQIPNAPITTNDTVCGSGNAILTASGAPSDGSYLWYTVPAGGTPISGQTSATLTINNVTATTDRYVSIIRNGCEGERTQVTAIYFNNVDAGLTITGNTICANTTTTTIDVLGSEAGVSYQSFFGGNPISNVETGGGNITLNINTSGMSVGNNAVTIQATQSGCGSVTMNNSATVTLLALPAVSITPSSSLSFCEGEDVTLTATSASSYLWSNGATTPSILVDASGTFSVTITDANGCSATSSDVNTVENLNPVPVISANGATTTCNGSSVELIASGGTSYIWSNGATTSTIQASQAGIYNFTAFNGTCSVVSSDIEVFVNPAPSVTANASQTSICLGESVTLTGDGAISYSWSNGVVDGASFVPSFTTTYQVIGTDANGCTAQANITVTVNQLPDASFISSLASFCPGLSSMDLVANNSNHDTYNWYEGGNPLQMNGNASITISSAGTYELEVIDINGCTNTSTLVVNSSSAPSVSISSSNTSFCVGSSELITATFETGATYTWYNGAVMVNGPSSNNTYNASIAGNYMVIMTNAGGCEGTSNTITLTTNPVPVANITSNTTTICAGGSAILSVTPVSGASYQWNLNGNPILGETGTTYSATASSNYTVEVNDGCSALSNVIVISTGVLPNNAGTISGTSSLCAGESQIFSIGNVVNATSYNWTITPSNAGSISQGQGTNSVTVNTTNTNFTLTVVPQNACGNGGSSQRSVTVSTGGFCAGDIMFAANQTNICEGNQVTFTNYSNPNQFMGLTAAWNFGAGASPATATGNGPHTVTYNTSGLKTVTLSYQDTFGNVFDSETKTNYINVSGVVNTSAISGNNSILCNSNNETYSVIQTSGSSYNWTVPTGATILSGQGSNMITVNMSGNQGAIAVVETNTSGCIGNTVTMSVAISNPVVTSVISGPTDVNCDATDLVYSVVNTNGSSYQWTIPSGANINNGQGSNLISVDFNTNFGIITVTESNADGCVGQPQEINVDCNVSIVNNEGLNINVYPNPVNDYFYLSFNDTFESVALKLYDNMGKIVKSIIVQSKEEINVQDLARGIYYGSVQFENETKTFKIIKQ